jgi:diguanylate cyclase (GGDEF)-like protein/PAS domain S-box-containing protein
MQGLARQGRWHEVVFLFLAVAATGWFSLNWTRTPGQVSAVWVGNGLVVGALMYRRTAEWWRYLLTGLAADQLVRHVLFAQHGIALGVGLANLLEILIVAGTVRRFVPNVLDPKGWVALGGIATGSTFLAVAISGVLASALFAWAYGSPFGLNFATWFTAHVVGMVIVATATIVFLREGVGLARVRNRWSFALCTTVLVVTCIGVFSQARYPLLFLVYPPLLWLTFAHRFIGVVVGLAIVGVSATFATAMGFGPFVGVHMETTTALERTLLLQLFLGCGCMLTFPVALTMAQRSRLLARMRESEQRYRLLADNASDIIVRLDSAGRRLYVSPSVTDLLGWTPEELTDQQLELTHPQDVTTRESMLREVFRGEEPSTWLYRVRHKDGSYRWLENVARKVPSPERAGEFDIVYAARDATARVEAEQTLHDAQRELEALARTDPATGLANRRQFDERFQRALARADRSNMQLALLLIDIDKFKEVNDRHGHACGDFVLTTFGARLGRSVRAGDLVARLGGDEFAVLIEDLAALSAAESVAKKLIAAMGAPIEWGGGQLQVTTSIGIGYSSELLPQAALLDLADSALYRAKHAGRNRYEVLVADSDN